MIAKIMKGSDFRGVVNYILNEEKGTQIIDAFVRDTESSFSKNLYDIGNV